jgi:hypothetical protein
MDISKQQPFLTVQDYSVSQEISTLYMMPNSEYVGYTAATQLE